MKDYQDIQQLINRFFEGETSLEEEQQLYAFYDSHDVLPEELEKYREMFAGFGAIAWEDEAKDETKNEVRETSKASHAKQKTLPHRKLFYVLSGIAATLFLCLGIFASVHIHEEKLLARSYEGSYIIVNGERIDDLSRIKPAIEQALSKANDIECNLSENSVVRDAEQNLLNNVSDPKERARIQQLLNE